MGMQCGFHILNVQIFELYSFTFLCYLFTYNLSGAPLSDNEAIQFGEN